MSTPFRSGAFRLSPSDYSALTDAAQQNPEAYWQNQSTRLDWIRSPSSAQDTGNGWFADGTLNASVNCLDRHLETKGEQTALIWQAEEADHVVRLTYRDLHARVCQMANVLRDHGISRGDRVAVHLPTVIEGVVGM